jgi:adenylate kinase
MKIILLGAPGSGKGTQADHISKELSIPTISTGAIFREAMQKGTEIGLKAKKYIDAGMLVPDDVVLEIVHERLSCEDCKSGYILDGFPRTIYQAEALDKMTDVDHVISLEVPDADIEKRLTGRRVCSDCGKTYHVMYDTSARNGICSECGGMLTIRDDDKPETVQARLEVYHKQSEPLKDYYKNQGKLQPVDGRGSVDDIRKLILKALSVVI